jgi:hypothetical protein
MSEMPLLKDDDRPVWPADGMCPVYGRPLKVGFVYLSAGAVLMDDSGANSIHTDRVRAFFNIGRHGTTEGRSTDVEIVANLSGGQFDLQYCSRRCAAVWFEKLLARLPPDDEA